MSRMSTAGDDIPDVLCIQIDREVLEKARQRDRASFFEDEGLTEFLNLQWDTPVEKNLVQEFIESYHVTSRTVKLSTRKISLDDELMLEVFHLPLGIYKMPKTSKATKLFSPYFSGRSGGDDGFLVRSCNDEVWLDRFVFLQNFFCIRTCRREIPYHFIEFLQAKGRKRCWFDAFKWFFQAEIGRIRRSGGAETCTIIGTHITLLLAHAKMKKQPPAEDLKPMRVTRGRVPFFSDKIETKCAELKQKRVTKGLLISALMSKESHEPVSIKEEKLENEIVEEEGEDHQDEGEEEQTIRPSLNNMDNEGQTIRPFLNNMDNVADHILRHFDMGREGIRDLMTRMVGLRNEVDSWKNEYVNQIATLQKENDVLKDEVDKWKSDCAEMQQARDELETKITSLLSATRLRTTENTNKLNRFISGKKRSLGVYAPPISPKRNA